MNFKNSPFYGARVAEAKRQRGWLSNQEFYSLGRQEFRDFRDSTSYSGDGFLKLFFILGIIYVISKIF